MKNILTFDFSVDKENKTITVTRDFDASQDLVWDAFTKSEILDQWWAPEPWKAKTGYQDFREGGRWNYAMIGPEGEEHWAVFNYEKIQPKSRYSGRDSFTDAQGNPNNEAPSMHWDVTFRKEGDYTRMKSLITFAQLSDLETILKMGFKEGYSIALNGLDKWLAENRK
jgi:uncharacterized protein YndB with AHSA1/START domain